MLERRQETLQTSERVELEVYLLRERARIMRETSETALRWRLVNSLIFLFILNGLSALAFFVLHGLGRLSLPETFMLAVLAETAAQVPAMLYVVVKPPAKGGRDGPET